MAVPSCTTQRDPGGRTPLLLALVACTPLSTTCRPHILTSQSCCWPPAATSLARQLASTDHRWPLSDVGAASIAASRAYLTHAAEQHAAGHWVPDPDVGGYTLAQLMRLAVQVGCKQFFAQLLPHLRPQDAGQLLGLLIDIGAADEVASMLRSGSVSAATQYHSRDMLTHSLWCQQPAIVQLLLQHGAPVTVESLKAAVGSFRPQPGMLRMLLAAGRPPTIASPWTCPVGALLNPTPWDSWRVSTAGCSVCHLRLCGFMFCKPHDADLQSLFSRPLHFVLSGSPQHNTPAPSFFVLLPTGCLQSSMHLCIVLPT